MNSLNNTIDTPITIYHMAHKSNSQDDDNNNSNDNINSAWWDLCAGPHVASTGELNADAILLEEVSGAYWRGKKKQKNLCHSFHSFVVFVHW